MRVAFLGLGLVGGSLARALHEDPAGGWSIAAWTPRGSGPRLAREAGVVDLAAPTIETAIEGADLVVLAAPPTECLGLLDELGGPSRRSLGDGAVITDVASTKAAVLARAASHGLRFVGGHPMAGRELAGYAAADPGLFADRPWVIVPPADDDEAVGRVLAIVGPTRARVVRMDASEHDSLVAAISHLPLVASVALVEAVAGTGPDARDDWPAATALAAGGWASMTRLARGDATMGAGIAATNAPAIAARLRDMRAMLDAWITLLEADGGPDELAIHARLAAARARLLEDEERRG